MRDKTEKNETNKKGMQAGFSENSVEKSISESPSEEDLKRELEEIKKKREAYFEATEREVLAIRKENAAKRRKKMTSFAKVAVVVLVAGIGVFSFSMRSEATRMWWLKSVNRVIGNDSGHVVDNDDHRVISDLPEQEAMAEIEEEAGVPMPDLYYKPAGMEFDGYEYDKDVGYGALYYLYNGYAVILEAFTSDKNTAYSWNYDGKILKEEAIELPYGTVVIREIRDNEDAITNSVAQWTYHNHQYQMTGKLPFEEIKKIFENIFY